MLTTTKTTITLPPRHHTIIIIITQHLHQNCRYDVCANQENTTNAKKAACATLEAFALECSNIGLGSDTWRMEANCR